MPKLSKVFWLGSIVFVLFSSLAGAQSLNDPRLHVSELVSGLSQPTAMAFIGFNDILVLHKNDGRVRRVINGVLQTGDVLNLAVENASERGLLGIAVHPNFHSNRFVYLYFTHSGATCGLTPSSPPVNRVCRFFWDGNSLIDPTAIIDLPATPGPNHNGGTMTFGPDGKLYIIIGDLNRDGQLQNLSMGPAPDDSGVILRLNDDGTVPSDNPFFSQGGNLAKYYGYGVRNSFGLAFDPLTGQLWNTENGPLEYDEINLVLPGLNSGWERVMGPVNRDAEGTADLVQFPGAHYADPKFSWFNPVGVTGIVFMKSPLLGVDYQDDVLAGDINNGNLYHFKVSAARNGFDFISPDLTDRVADSSVELQEIILGTGFGGITDLKVGPDGFLYILSFGLGKVFVVSSDFATENAIFVRQQYLDFLDREPDAGGFSAWGSALNGGLPRGTMIEIFMDSGEFFLKGKFIVRAYQGLLMRDADHAGFRGWLELLLAGMSREQIVQFFIDSGEFQSSSGSNLTNAQFVQTMYANVLLRSADTAGLNFWVGQLNGGQMTRAQVAVNFLDSPEFQNLSATQNRVEVSLLYFDMLRRDPDASGFEAWVSMLNSGTPLTAAIDSFLNSAEYNARF